MITSEYHKRLNIHYQEEIWFSQTFYAIYGPNSKTNYHNHITEIGMT